MSAKTKCYALFLGDILFTLLGCKNLVRCRESGSAGLHGNGERFTPWRLEFSCFLLGERALGMYCILVKIIKMFIDI